MDECPLCKKNDKVYGMSPLYEYPWHTEAGRKFTFICERCRYFFDDEQSGRTY